MAAVAAGRVLTWHLLWKAFLDAGWAATRYYRAIPRRFWRQAISRKICRALAGLTGSWAA
ncbi:hypothetical protein IE4771_PB00213 (plasmid) [Rhizobium etli bv. mimosae str. IE4771]|uniref:Uncharacterized protein n=1 Tax=Rhizobium etli bv. mimosae str. IE4771 TaxID=1432050 RepID=A0A060I491_RHIET|nr:hypothetical protein IE4771_PB00213 [Rhizobium sp. IE4771]